MYGYRTPVEEAYIRQCKRQGLFVPSTDLLPTKLLLSNFEAENIIRQLLIAHPPGGMSSFEINRTEFQDTAVCNGVTNIEGAWQKALEVLLHLNAARNKQPEEKQESKMVQ